MFNVGDLVHLKTTGETGTVETVNNDGTFDVRFPKIDKEGRVEHTAGEIFFGFELETKENKLKRELEDIVLEQQIRVEAKERFDKWSEKRGNVIEMPPPGGRVQ